MLRLLEAGERVAAYECDADWYDIGTVDEYERAVVDIEQFPEKYDVTRRCSTRMTCSGPWSDAAVLAAAAGRS